MARIVGVNLPSSKRAECGLTYIFGIGLKRSRDILNKAKISLDKRVHQFNEHEIATIEKLVQGYRVEGDLRKEITLNIKRLQEIGSYRGSRHRRGLPTRGQRTKTNARTRKGPRKAGSAIALKRMVTKK